MSDPCSSPTYTPSCAKPATMDVPNSYSKTTKIAQDKDVSIIFNCGNFQIPLRIRKRKFTIESSISLDNSSAQPVVDPETGTTYLCGTKGEQATGSVSEAATYTDSKLYLYDRVNKHAAWVEYEFTCNFSSSNSSLTYMKEPQGNIAYCKIKVGAVNIIQTERMCIAINGIKEILEELVTINKVYTESTPLIFVSPNVSGISLPLEDDLRMFGWYDYNAGTPEESREFAKTEGGKDFYYTYWLKQMGLYQDEDKKEATDRFDAYFMHDGMPPSSIILKPEIYCGAAKGSIVTFGENTLVSVAKRNSYFNKLLMKGVNTPIPELLDGNNLRLYPVGVI